MTLALRLLLLSLLCLGMGCALGCCPYAQWKHDPLCREAGENKAYWDGWRDGRKELRLSPLDVPQDNTDHGARIKGEKIIDGRVKR